MNKSGSNGQGATAESTSESVTKARPDPFEKIRAYIEEEKKRAYAEGFRRATFIIAQSVGRLDPQGKERITNLLDQLQSELDAAEVGL